MSFGFYLYSSGFPGGGGGGVLPFGGVVGYLYKHSFFYACMYVRIYGVRVGDEVREIRLSSREGMKTAHLLFVLAIELKACTSEQR